ncbi:hypothetical protein EXIGLDRAFT_839651 [Exidia glandulosa HHB12029]|uniref:F-box domain-containing protein n=1 Tax=Exidia glandulosa HHB12029 TaxID=1314781 RepID=A0A165EWT3_EXIGL|nr:hypothetical protein EXIGLDRAFT_839651 [Exidia glandulosa HHB12029]
MYTPPIPPEIVDTIIDCAWELYCESTMGRANARWDPWVNFDREPLNVLALVSRSWVARARHCAFQDLMLRRKWSSDARQFTTALLEHPLCTIREHVLRLHFEGGGRPIHDIADISYLQGFTNLKSLCLEHLGFEEQPLPAQSSIFESVLPLPATLQNLELGGCIFPNVERLLELIACATGLRSLRCSEVFVRASIPRTGIQSTPQLLTELSIYAAYDSCLQVLEWISSAPVPPRIANLELRGISAQNMDVVSKALHILGPSVVTLSLLLAANLNQYPLAIADLSTLQNLRCLVIACSFSQYGPIGVEVPLILARLAENCKTAQSITFRIYELSAEDDGLLTVPWDAIVATLNGPSFRQLERIVLQLEPPPPWLDEWPHATWDLLKRRITISQQLLGNVTLVCLLERD